MGSQKRGQHEASHDFMDDFLFVQFLSYYYGYKINGSQSGIMNMASQQRLEYPLDFGFVINDIHEHFAAGFGELLEFFPALEVSDANHLN